MPLREAILARVPATHPRVLVRPEQIPALRAAAAGSRAADFAALTSRCERLLSEADRAKCREVMRTRGAEMYRHLYLRQLWEPYESHANRGWHKLGEVAIAVLVKSRRPPTGSGSP